jgi:hypothetical protein
MPQFARNGDHLKEHEEIHHGLDEYVAYIKKCRKDNKEWDGEKMKSIMDSFRGVLFKHLDHEVESLSGEEMKKVRPASRGELTLVLEIRGAETDTDVDVLIMIPLYPIPYSDPNSEMLDEDLRKRAPHLPWKRESCVDDIYHF